MPALRQILMTLSLLLAVVSLSVLLAARSSTPLLGLWDSGHFSKGVMPEPELIPDEELGKLRVHRHILFQPAPGQNQGDSLPELFKWYDLDARYVDATVNAGHLDPARVPSDPFEVVLVNDN